MSAPSKAAPEAKRQREPLLVDLTFQLRELLPMTIFVGIYAVLLFAFLFLPLSRSMAAERELDMAAGIILQGYLSQIHLYVWPLLLVAGLAAGYFRIYRSLRVLRPVYRLHYALGAVAAGEHPTLQIKPREEFQFLAEDLAQLNQKMKLLSTRNRDILLNVNAHIKRMDERINTGEIIPRADIEEFLGALRAQVDKSLEAAPPGRR
jgi:hypothetical protein